jgi:hypothetical protein
MCHLVLLCNTNGIYSSRLQQQQRKPRPSHVPVKGGAGAAIRVPEACPKKRLQHFRMFSLRILQRGGSCALGPFGHLLRHSGKPLQNPELVCLATWLAAQVQLQQLT